MTFTLVFYAGLLAIFAFVASIVITTVQALLAPETWASLINGFPYFVAGVAIGTVVTAFVMEDDS